MKGMIRRLLLWLGMADLRKECARHVEATMGRECVAEFDELYEKIGRGVPVSMAEAVVVIDIVETVKGQMRAQSVWGRLGRGG